ncbi:MAG: polysaccharide biosynthesis tyrosine autokinase [Flavobacteriales bacterium]|nr:polysaccharide biosynthesis tyrosine autokinase [Flavobacteriales bacterium]
MEKSNEIVSRKDILKVLVHVISNWYLFVLFPLIAFGLSYIYTHRIPDVYAAKCQILLKSNETYDYQQQIYRGLGFSSKYASYEETASQMRVIKSSNLIEEVLQTLPLNVSYYIMGRLKVTEVYEHMPFHVIADDRSSIHPGMTFQLKILDEQSFQLFYEIEGESRALNLKFDQLILNDGIYLRIERQANLNGVSVETLKQINYMFKVHKNNVLISKYKSNLDVKNIDYTSIIEITLRDEIPSRAEEVLDTLAQLYLKNTVQSQTNINENTLNYIDRQLNEVIRIINEIESELESFKEEKAILNLSKEEETYFNRFLDLEQQIRSNELEFSSIDELIDYLLKNEEIEYLLPPSIFVNDNDPKLKDQVSSLYALRAEYNAMMETGTSANPRVASLLDQITLLKQDILQYLDARKTALETRQKELVQESDVYESRIKNIPKTQREILNIERRLEVNEELYSFLLSKRAETVIARAGLVPETKIIERARSMGVIYPDKGRMNLVNALIGLGLAVIIVLIRVLIFQKIGSIGQLQAATSTSILGSIPRKNDFSKTYRIKSGHERSDIVQAFRVLRTNLQYLAPNKACTRVLVTSLLPGEGKTFASVNMASVMGIAEKKVLIIDFDLHKPRLAQALELPNDKGVSSFLIGKHSIEEVIQNTDIETLHAITSGPVPPNASELVLHEEVNKIFEYAESRYDYIFLDTPPISLITDGIMLMDKVDIKLFVLNSKSTTNTSLDYIEHLIDKKKFEHCALVLNEEKLSRLNYYYSKYGQGSYGYGGYGYGYGYGHGKAYGETTNDKE